MATKTAVTSAIMLPKLQLKVITIKLVGDSPLICHAWSAKAKKQMLDKQMKKAVGGKEAKNPNQDYLESLYHLPGGTYGFPTTAIKSAAVDAASFVDGITKVMMRGAFHIDGEFVTLDGTPSMREDIVRVGMGTADVRFRGEFREWSTTFDVRFNATAISPEQITNMFGVAGFAIGIGEWRPARDGQYGRFHVG